MPPTDRQFELADDIVTKLRTCIRDTPLVGSKLGSRYSSKFYHIISTQRAEKLYERFEYNEELDQVLPLFPDEFNEKNGFIDIEIFLMYDRNLLEVQVDMLCILKLFKKKTGRC